MMERTVESIDRLLGAAASKLYDFSPIRSAISLKYGKKKPNPTNREEKRTQRLVNRRQEKRSAGITRIKRDGGCIMYSLPHFTSHQHIFVRKHPFFFSFFYSSFSPLG